MSGLGNMAGLGASLPDRGGGKKGGGKGGKKKQDPEDDDEGEDDPDFAEGVDQKEVMKALSQLQGNAGLVSALQQKLDGLVGMSSGFVESLHFKIRARVEELGNLQENHDELYEKFLEEKRELEAKYRALYQPLYNKRAAIVKGEVDVEATPEEGEEEEAGEEVPAGIPEFWQGKQLIELVALKNHEMLEEQITERDEPALKHLVDVTSSPLEGEQKGFTLDFHFEQPNPFFSNAVISKTYHMAGLVHATV